MVERCFEQTVVASSYASTGSPLIQTQYLNFSSRHPVKHKLSVVKTTRSQCTASLTEYSKSALTDHANQANHTNRLK